MRNLTDTIQFDESKNLSEQSPEFQAWFNEFVNPQINDRLQPDLLDQYKRPVSYTVHVDGYTITVFNLYINADQTNYACRDFQLILKTA